MQNTPTIPYEEPGARDLQRRAQLRWHSLLVGQLLIAFFVFVSSVVLCAVAGGLLGKVIATLFPHYYPSVFAEQASRPAFDAVEVGIGTGIGQGAAAGIFVGAIIVLALAIANWRGLRRQG
jgi:hypothetical protein